MMDCYSCTQNEADPLTAPTRERVYDDGLWRVAHAFDSALPGWMVLVSRRHIQSLSELTPGEAAVLGPLLHAVSVALEQLLGAVKSYVMFFAEGEGFSHLHIHVVPRMRDQPQELRATRIFGYLDRPKDEWVPPDEMDRIADELRPLIVQQLEMMRGA